MTDREGGRAFPNDGSWANNCPEGGMSVRDYFAGIALRYAREQASKASENDINKLLPGSGSVTREQIAARLAYVMADAMIAERAKP